MGGILLAIPVVLDIVKAGIAGTSAIVDAVRDGRARIQDWDGRLLTAEEVELRCAEAEAQRVTTAAGAESRIAEREIPRDAAGLRTDGPTLEEFVAAGYAPAGYPPHDYAALPSEGLTRFREEQAAAAAAEASIAGTPATEPTGEPGFTDSENPGTGESEGTTELAPPRALPVD